MIYFTAINKKPRKKYSIDKKGVHLFVFFNIAGKILFEIKAENARVYIFGLFFGEKNDRFQLETLQHHLSQKTFSDLLIKGVFFDKARFVHRGLIRIEKTAFASHAYQKSQNLLLSDQSFVESRPELEILTDDVFCTHGSTVGQPDREQLFYLKNRSLSSKDAEKLLVAGFFEEIFAKIEEVGGGAMAKNYREALRP